MIVKRATSLLLCAMLGLFGGVSAGGDEPTPPPVVSDARIREFRDLRFGMFVCWSFSTFSNVEWTRGVRSVEWFNPTGFDPDQWCKVAKSAGMKYILFLTKHHDGFCLWDTATTDWRVTKSPLKVDVLRKVREACDRHGIKLALYFSEGDWTWPGMKDAERKKAQLKELCTKYGPIEFFWLDCAQTDGGLDLGKTVHWIKRFQPNCFVGSNTNRPGADLHIGEMGGGFPLDDVAKAKGYLAAEFTYPILGGRAEGRWFYTMPEWDQRVVPAGTIYRDYLAAVRSDNIFSLDVAPDRAGKIRAIDVKTLREVGEMIRNPPPTALSAGKPARASSVWGPGFEAAKAFDDDEETRWGAAPGSRSGWLEVDLGKEAEIARAVVAEIGYPRTRQFVIEYKAGDAWQPLHRGRAIAGRQTYDFPAVTTRYVRLNVLSASEVPTIEEFQLYVPKK
jgi:alpha-L-fucosidase